MREAESWSAWGPDGGDGVQTESNNVPGTPPEDGYLNGGTSVVDIEEGDWLEYEFAPPEPGTSNFEYTILLRISNYAVDGNPDDEDVEIKISSGGVTVYAQTLDVPRTSAEHDYLILGPSTPALLTSGVPHTILVTFLGVTPQYSFDDVVLRSRGVAQ